LIELSAAADSPAWLCRRSINEIMTICFEQHNCQQIVSRMAIDNERAIQIYDFLGFDTVILPNMRGKGRHEHLKLLTKDKWAMNKLNRQTRE
jgi:RimJ/RimL family protein N-acetyltransferase